MRKVSLKKICILALALALCPGFSPGKALAGDEGITVSVRAENSMVGNQGNISGERTILRADEVKLSGGLTVLDALVKAAYGGIDYQTGEYGAWVTAIIGLTDTGEGYSWMFAVNDEPLTVAVDRYELKNGDKIVAYFVNWTADASYAYFSPSAVKTETGKSVVLTLNGVHFSEGTFPVAGAQVIVSSEHEVPLPRLLYVTDGEGRVELTFAHKAVYQIRAVKYNEDGLSVISRPFAEITVGDPPYPEREITDPGYVIPDPGQIFHDGPDGAEPIQPMPMPLAPVTFNAETGELYIMGQLIPLPGGMKPFFDPDTGAYGEIYIPLRALAEAIGGEVEWESKTRTVTLRFMQVTASFSVDKPVAGMPVHIKENRVYIPSGYLIELINLELYF